MLTMQTRQGSPLYLQMKHSLRRMLTAGAIQEGEPLPSAGEVAAQYAVNPLAVTRAYAELEAEGYLRREPGAGYTAAAGADCNQARVRELLETLEHTTEELLRLGVSPERLWAQMNNGREAREK